MLLKKYHKFGNKLLIVKYGISVTNHAYFSVTADIGVKRRGRGRGRYRDYILDENGSKYEWESGGCQHKEILSVFPDMADIISLHLSDINGTPMYALENGFYHWSSGNYPAVKDLLRITDAELDKLNSSLQLSENKKQLFDSYVLSQKPRWRAEANAVIAKYNLPTPEMK